MMSRRHEKKIGTSISEKQLAGVRQPNALPNALICYGWHGWKRMPCLAAGMKYQGV
jgi:hypothetical protein